MVPRNMVPRMKVTASPNHRNRITPPPSHGGRTRLTAAMHHNRYTNPPEIFRKNCFRGMLSTSPSLAFFGQNIHIITRYRTVRRQQYDRLLISIALVLLSECEIQQ